MSDLPRGTLTFLFTDVEGSTELWDQEPAAMKHAMIRHDALFESIVQCHDGVVVRPRGEGDSRFAVFQEASSAAAAASQFQQQMHAEHWPTTTPISVRAALHTGEASLRDGDYYGSAVNRCARLRSLAHGGQTLLSQTTAQLVWDSLSESVELRDLGEHVLKGLTRPEHIFQVVVPGVPSDFPPLQSLGHRPTNVPSQTTTFVGREKERDTVRGRLLDPAVRLVTLIGPGGTGKTRLALQVADDVLQEFADGVFFVTLSTLNEPGLLVPTIVKTLGLREIGGETVADTLKYHLRDKDLLLVLDNFDHLVSEAPELASLLSDCPRLKILVTSRETLHIRGNQEISVPPLGVPNLKRLPPLEHMLGYESIRLFRERARDIKPDFELTDENAAFVAAICSRLDGLPLAIELAAARIRLFSPQALLARLDRRLPLLTGGSRDLPDRQQTLRGTIDWSYDLLDVAEQALFRRLSMCAGGFTFDAAEAVVQLSESPADASDDRLLEIDVLNGLDSLVSKSLLYQDESHASIEEPRFGMLGTIREYGLDQLDAHGETAIVGKQHAAFYLALAEKAEAALMGPDQGEWLERLEVEHDNMRAAIEFSLAAEEVNVALRLAGALWPFWSVRGHFAEGRQWLEAALLPGGDDQWQAKALTGAGTMAWSQGEFDQAVTFHSKALELYEKLGDNSGIASALNNLAVQAEAENDPERAVELYQRSLALYREQGDDLGIANALNNLGAVDWEQSDYDRARSLFEESLALRRKIGDHQRVADALYNLGEIAYYQHDYPSAVRLYHESLVLRRALKARGGAALCLAALAAVSAVQGQLEHAAKLCGAAEALFEDTGIWLDSSDRSRFDEITEMLRTRMGDNEYVRLWNEGQSMSVQDAIEYGLCKDDPPQDAAMSAR